MCLRHCHHHHHRRRRRRLMSACRYCPAPPRLFASTGLFLSSSFPLPGRPLSRGLLQEFDESYVQTGQGQLYSWSSQTHRRGGTPMVLRCNHTIIYEGQEERQGPVLQLLRVSGVDSVYNVLALSLDFHITASLLIPGVKKKRKGTMRGISACLNTGPLICFADDYQDTCPKGFVLDAASYCAGTPLASSRFRSPPVPPARRLLTLTVPA